MPPVTLTLPHKLGRKGAKARIQTRLIEYRHKLERYVSGISFEWENDYRLNFSAAYGGHIGRGSAFVRETDVLIELNLPVMLTMVANGILPKIENDVALLLL